MNFIGNESATKLRGSYYTEPMIARFLARWTLENSPRRVLEPGCGDGAFFSALRDVGAARLQHVVGFEIDSAEATKAAKQAKSLKARRGEVIRGDYLGWSIENLNRGPLFDAALGNPPFIRYQYLSEEMQERASNIFAALGLPFTKHTNAWVPFVLCAISQLAPGGRLAMVVPSELLHVLHAQGLRDYLLEQCSKIVVVDPQELWFVDALQGTVLLMAEKASSTSRTRQLAVIPVRGREFFEASPSELLEQADFVDGRKVRGKWMSVLLTRAERAALEESANNPGVHRFADLADVDVGIVTGANKFFLVPDDVVKEYELEPWARPMFGRSGHVPGVVYDHRTHAENRRKGLPTNFLSFAVEDTHLVGKVRDYIKQGEASGLHTRFKCRIRSPWYSVPSVWSSPVGMLKRSHDFPRLIKNDAGAFTTDTAYRIRVSEATDPNGFVFCFVNSLTALSAELEGRHYGGGVLELVPSEIEKLLVPIPKDGIEYKLAALDRAFRSGQPAEEILAHQTAAVLGAMKLGESVATTLFGAWNRLRRRRQREASEDPIIEEGNGTEPVSGKHGACMAGRA
jgi:adenine-specific DNA methylase